jgi:hypothetical protein
MVTADMKLSKSIMPIIIPAILMILMSCGDGQKEIRLTFHYKTGAVYDYEKTVKDSFKYYENGKLIQDNDKTRESRIKEEILGLVGDTDARIRLTETMTADINDSNDSQGILEYISDANGRIKEILKTDSLNPEVLEFFKNYCEQSMPVFPDTIITEGYSWKQSVNLMIADSGNTTAETIYKVRSFVRENGYDCAVIEYNGRLIIPFRKIGSDSSLTIILEHIKSDGVLYFAYRDGIIISQKEMLEFNSEGTKIKNGVSSEIKMAGRVSNSLRLVSAK